MESSSKGEDEVGGYNSSNVKKAKLQSTLAALLDDPILSDVPKKPTLSDVDTLISLEMGSAMRISVQKLDGTSFGIQSLTVFFLAFNHTLNMRLVELNFLLIWFRCGIDEFGYGEGFEACN